MAAAAATSIEAAAQKLLNPNGDEFDVSLLDDVITAAYSPTDPNRAMANKTLMALQETPNVWTKADAILERAQNPQSRFFGLQVLDDAIRTRCVVYLFFYCRGGMYLRWRGHINSVELMSECLPFSSFPNTISHPISPPSSFILAHNYISLSINSGGTSYPPTNATASKTTSSAKSSKSPRTNPSPPTKKSSSRNST